MATKLTAGQRPEKRSKPAPAPEELAEQVSEVAAAEKFPDNFADSLKLLQELSAETVTSEEEWNDKQPRLLALKAHVFKIQQGLPVVHENEHVTQAVYLERRAGLQRTKLELLGRENTAVKELLAAYDALLAEKKPAPEPVVTE